MANALLYLVFRRVAVSRQYPFDILGSQFLCRNTASRPGNQYNTAYLTQRNAGFRMAAQGEDTLYGDEVWLFRGKDGTQFRENVVKAV